MQPDDLERMLEAVEGTEGGEGSAETSAHGQWSEADRQWSSRGWQSWRSGGWSWDPWSRYHGSYWGAQDEGDRGEPGESDGRTRQPGASSASEPAAAAPPSSQWEWCRDDRWWNDKSWTSYKGDYSDPPAWPGWNNFRLWKRAIRRWHNNTDVAVWRRSEKILKTFEWDLQAKMDHLDEKVLASESYLDRIIEVLDVLAGERESSERRRAVRAALYEGVRKPSETLAQYALRRESQFQSAGQFLDLPSDLKGFMMEEQAGLTKQGIQNLRVLTSGSSDYGQVCRALKVLDVEEESLVRSGGGRTNYFQDSEDFAEDLKVAEDDDPDLILYALEEQDLDEFEALSFLTEWKTNKRTWAESRELKAAKKKDRLHFDRPDSRPSRPTTRRKLSIDELKRVSRCANCLERGHWQAECTRPYKPREPGTRLGPERNKPAASAFAFLGLASSSSTSTSFSYLGSWCSGELRVSEDEATSGKDIGKAAECQESFVSIPAGHAIIDPGAAQDLVGKPAFDRLRKKLAEIGLQPVILSEEPPAAAGIGGKADALFVALTPCFLGQQPGIVKLTVLKQDIPHLLSIGLLEHAQSIIDTSSNKIQFRAFGCSADMTRLPSGHRTLDISSWDGEEFNVPEQVLKDFNLKPDAFKLSDSAISEVYMAASSIGVGAADSCDAVNDFFYRVLNGFSERGQFQWLEECLVLVEFQPTRFQLPPKSDIHRVLRSSWWLIADSAIRLENQVEWGKFRSGTCSFLDKTRRCFDHNVFQR